MTLLELFDTLCTELEARLKCYGIIRNASERIEHDDALYDTLKAHQADIMKLCPELIDRTYLNAEQKHLLRQGHD